MVCSLKKQGFGWSYFFSITNRPIREQTQVDIISYFADGLATNFAFWSIARARWLRQTRWPNLEDKPMIEILKNRNSATTRA
jgi:hypothetical protein